MFFILTHDVDLYQEKKRTLDEDESDRLCNSQRKMEDEVRSDVRETRRVQWKNGRMCESNHPLVSPHSILLV